MKISCSLLSSPKLVGDGISKKIQPLVFKDIDQKFNDNLSFGKLSNDETKKLNIFIESFFDKPDYSKINLF